MIRIFRYILIALFLLVLGAVYFELDPGTNMFFPKCPVMMLTGYPCAGCGSQRAVHALLHLDLAAALRYNFLAVLFVPFILLLLFSSMLRERMPKLYQLTHHKYVAYGTISVIVIWWILRIVFGWYV